MSHGIKRWVTAVLVSILALLTTSYAESNPGARIGREAAAKLADASRIAAGDWSEPVNNLRGRLLLFRRRLLGDGRTRETVVYLDLQNASQAADQTLTVNFDPRLQFELRDSSDKPVPEKGMAASGGRPGACTITLPYDSRIRLRLSPFGFGEPEDLLIPLIDHSWRIAHGDARDYFLVATVTAPEPRDHLPGRPWGGKLQLPAMKIGTKGR